MNSPVQQIKERLSIEDIVSSYIKLEKTGANFKAKCPFHNEKTASFFISADRGNYYCFGCGAKGDIFTFIQEFEGLDFKGALKILAQKAGINLENYNSEEESEKEKLYRILEEATKFFEKNLLENKEAIKYLSSRGIQDKTIKDFRIGFANLEWRDLYFYLQKKGFKDNEIEKAGLAKRGEKTKDFYDRFRGRVMFPIADSSGRIIAFSGRIFIDDGKSAKYLNSPETPVFSKSSVLYGLDKAKDSIRKNNFSILVEGQFDLIMSHQAGFKNTVATSGTALTDSTISKENVVSNLGLIRRLSGNLILAFDADKAGIKASERASKIALSIGMDVKVAALPESVDPADLILKEGNDAWKEAIRNSRHIIEFLLSRILKNNDGKDVRYVGREIKDKILPYVDSLESSIEQAHFIKIISNLSQISEDALKEDLSKIEKDSKYENKLINNIKEKESKIFRKDYILKRLLGIIFWQETLKEKTIDIEKILYEIVETTNTLKESILNNYASNKEDLIFEAEVFYGKEADLKLEVVELLTNLKEEYLKEKLSEKMLLLNKAEIEKNNTKSAEILNEINEINNKIQSIKSSRIKK